MQPTTKRSGITSSIRALAGSSILYRTALASMAIAAGANDAQALPTGGAVESGTVSITQPTSTDLVINQGSDRAIINWQNFDIMQGESTRFVQPSANSVALNRIVGGQNATQILGSLTANGQIILVNPNGVFFGAGSKVDVAGMVASTANISSANFLAGKLNFDQAGKADASIINKGAITAKDGGLVALVAPGVENDGTITANTGTITLASGSTMAVDMYGDNLYSFAVGRADAAGKNEKGEVMKDGVANNGVLTANGGRVQLTANIAKNIVTNVVNNTGVIEASAVHVEGGTVVLDGGAEGTVNVAGTIDAAGKGAGQQGGSVTVTGEHIKLAVAKIDTSGKTAGGKVRIGGDYHGAGNIAHAKAVDVDQASTINVSANGSGNAGSAVIWSDEKTSFSGSLLGSAGAAGGNGSYSEISSAGELEFAGTGDLHGVNGTNGTLLLDPQNITINALAAFGISTLLNLNSNVDIETSALAGTDAGNIIVNAAIKWFGNGALKLGANNNITVNNAIQSITNSTGNDGSITLQAGNNIALNNAALGTNTGFINLIGKNVALTNSSIAAGSGDIDIANSGRFSSNIAGAVRNDASKTGHVFLNQSTAGNIQNAIDAIGTYGSGGGKVTLGNGTFNQQVNIIGKSNFTLTGQGAANTTISSPDSLTTLFNNGDPIKAVVGVKDGDNVTLSDFRVNGLNKGDANYRFTGIAYDNAGGRITGTTVTNIEGNPANGVQGGNGIYAYVDSGTHSLEIDHNDVNHFQKTGIVLNGLGLTGRVHHNTVTGLGAVDFIAQNGIQFGFGANGTIFGNSINGIGYTPTSTSATGILLFQAGPNVEIRNNTVDGAGYAAGIYATGTNSVSIHDNTVRNVRYGIGADTANRVNINTNSITNATLNGVLLDGVTIGIISNSLIQNTGTDAISVVDSNGASIFGNYIGYASKSGVWGSAGNIKGDGIFVDNSDNATIRANKIAQTFSSVFDSGSGIHVTTSDRVTIGGAAAADGNKLNNIAWDGIKLGNDTNATVSNNTLEHVQRVGIYLGSVNGANVSENNLTKVLDNLTGYGAIASDFGGNLSITANGVFQDNNGSGVYMNSASGVNTISSNIINGTPEHGIFAIGSSALTANNNVIQRISKDGIHVETGSNTTLNGNDIHDVSGNGIYSIGLTSNTSSGQNIIGGNQVHHAALDGIFVDTATNLTLVENTVHDVKHFAIKLANVVVNGVNSTIVAANEIYNAGFNGIDMNGIDNAYIAQNFIHDVGPSHAFFAPGTAPSAALNYGDAIHAVNLRSVGSASTPAVSLPAGAYAFGTNAAPGNYATEFGGLAGHSVILSNNIKNIDHDAIHAETVVNAFINNNTVLTAGHDGIFAGALSVNTPSGTSIIAANDVSNVSRDGLHLESIANAQVTNNLVHIAGHDGIFGSSFTVAGAPGESRINTNTVYFTNHDGIHLETVGNANINDNLVHDLTHDGIYASNLTRTGFVSTNPSGSTNKGLTILNRNEVYSVGHDGIHLDTVQNLDANFNKIHDLSHDGFFASNLYTTSVPQLNYFSTIDHTMLTGIGHDGIHLELVQNASVTSTKLSRITNHGIFAANPVTTLDTIRNNAIGNGSYNNAYFGSNIGSSFGADGIHVEGIDRSEFGFNELHRAVDGAALHVIDSSDTFIHANTLTDSAFGMNLERSDIANVIGNTLSTNGIGTQLSSSDSGLLRGNIFTGNTLGINLDNSPSTFLVTNSLTTPLAGVGLRIANGSGGTRVFTTSFNGGNVAVQLTDPGSEMQFGDNGSIFSGNNFYFVLQNGAMAGDTLDASQQTFDGTRGANFTQSQLAAAETNRTIDVADDGSLGDVFYTDFISPAATFDTGLLDDFLSNRRNAYRRGNFSFAGRAINFVTDPIEPGSFDPRNTSLSLLNRANPTAAADIANLFATLAPAAGGNKNLTPQQLAALGPAAGGTQSAEKFASLAPAAGGAAGSCGNSFLGDGFTSGFSCGAQ